MNIPEPTLNIRPFTDALRAKWPDAFQSRYDSRAGGCRVVGLQQMFRGNDPLPATHPVKQGDRYLEVQLSGDARHRISHMLVMRDGPRAPDGSARFMRGTTHPTDFVSPEGMVIAVIAELAREDHKP